MLVPLREVIMPNVAGLKSEVCENASGGKDWYMNGVFIQAGVKNHNQRVYPVNEISRAVMSMKEKLTKGFSVLGEADHPDDLNINIDRVSHMIVDMEMRGNDGIGKLKLLTTPLGNICRTLLEGGVKLGVSSRGSGNVDASGNVSEFEIITVDIVANPSAPDAYPDAIYEAIHNRPRSATFWDIADSVTHDPSAQKYLEKEVKSFIQDLGRHKHA
jgi:hypothetical protein